MKRLMRGEQGYVALTLSMVVVLFSVLMVVPFLSYVQTEIRAAHKASNGLAGLTCAEGAVAYGLWKLQYDAAFVSSLQVDVPTTIDVPCDDELVPLITVTQKTMPPTLPDYLTQYAYADISVVLDISASVDTNEMLSFRQAANAIIDGFNLPVNGDRYHMGLSEFARSTQPLVSMTNNATVLHTAIDGITSTSRWTCS